MQNEEGKSIPTMVVRDHKTLYTHALRCPGKSTKEEEYSEQMVIKGNHFVEQLGYKRVAIKSDREQAMRAFEQRVQKSVNCEMVLTNSKRYGSKWNGKIEKDFVKLPTENRIGKTIPPIILSSIG